MVGLNIYIVTYEGKKFTFNWFLNYEFTSDYEFTSEIYLKFAVHLQHPVAITWCTGKKSRFLIWLDVGAQYLWYLGSRSIDITLLCYEIESQRGSCFLALLSRFRLEYLRSGSLKCNPLPEYLVELFPGLSSIGHFWYLANCFTFISVMILVHWQLSMSPFWLLLTHLVSFLST